MKYSQKSATHPIKPTVYASDYIGKWNAFVEVRYYPIHYCRQSNTNFVVSNNIGLSDYILNSNKPIFSYSEYFPMLLMNIKRSKRVQECQFAALDILPGKV